MPCWKSQNLHVMLPERRKLPSARCVMEDIRSQPATSVSLYQEIWSSLNCQITFASQIRTKAVWLKLEGHKWGIYSLFHLCRGLNNYSCMLCIHVHFWQASKGCFEKNNPPFAPPPPPPAPAPLQQITIQKSPSAQRYTTLNLFTDGASLDDWSRALQNFLSSPLWSKCMKAGG